MSYFRETCLGDFIRLTKCSLSQGEAGKFRDPSDAMRTIFWYQGLTFRKSVSSAFALGKELEPDDYWKTEDGKTHRHNNNWSGYKAGLHVPQDSRVALVEARFPGSARELRHVFWQMTRRRPRRRKELDGLEAQLAPKTRKVLIRWRGAERGVNGLLTSVFVSALLQLDCIECLAAMQIQCERAWLAHDTESALGWVREMHVAMLVHGRTLLLRELARPLMELLSLRLFSTIIHDGLVYEQPGAEYVSAILHLEAVRTKVQDKCISPMSEEGPAFTLSVLEGKKGFDLKYALHPYLREAVAGTARPEAAHECMRSKWLWTWGWNMLNFCRPHMFPPPFEVHKGTDLFARHSAQLKRDAKIDACVALPHDQI